MIAAYYGTAFARSYSVNIEDEFGIVDIVTEYDAEGNKTSESVSGEFTKDSGMIDSEGNVISFNGAEYETDDKDWTVSFIGNDGYEYKMYFTYVDEYYRNTGYLGFDLTALVRLQTIESNAGGYTLKVERAIATMLAYGLEPGNIFAAELSKGEETYDLWTLMEDDGTLYYVTRTEGEGGKFQSTRYFALSNIEDAPSGAMSDVETVPLYQDKFDAEELTVRTKYSEDGRSFVDILTTADGDEVVFMDFDGSRTPVTTSEYKETEEQFYISVDLERYTVKENGEYIVITEIA
ncbi:MAG: hypothetical protein IJR61_03195 [Clostridia bacterium]|nr:hypothetical protein [Clostridia bacterium]